MLSFLPIGTLLGSPSLAQPLTPILNRSNSTYLSTAHQLCSTVEFSFDMNLMHGNELILIQVEIEHAWCAQGTVATDPFDVILLNERECAKQRRRWHQFSVVWRSRWTQTAISAQQIRMSGSDGCVTMLSRIEINIARCGRCWWMSVIMNWSEVMFSDLFMIG